LIEKLLERFKGAYSYEEGIATLIMATGRIDGSGSLITSFKNTHLTGVPILLTLKNKKFQIPYENEFPLSITIEYTNQNDETKEATCTIPVYADKDLDFRIVMPESDEFVKEITDITLDGTDVGDINDEFQIIGLVGNISRFEAVKSIMISDSLYALKQAQLQKYVETAWDGGLKDLAKDFGINLAEATEQSIIRIVTRLFSNFIVPSKSIIQSSANIIFEIIDEITTIIVEGDFDDPYKVIYNVIYNSLEFDPSFIDILLIFAERYRPVPAEAVINIVFENGILQDNSTITDSGEVEITQDPIHFGITTFFGSGTIFGDATVTVLSLPTDYP
jgi:hypothetical protein